MKISIKIFGFCIASVLALGLVLFIFKKPIVAAALSSYFSSQQIPVRFSLDEISFKEVKFSHIRIGQRSEIPLIHLTYKNPIFGFSLNSIQISANHLDIPELVEMSQKFSTSSTENLKSDSVDFNEYCKSYLNTAMDLSVKNLTWQKATLPLNLKFNHIPNDARFTLQFSGETVKPQSFPLVSLESSRLNGDIELNCGENFQVGLRQLEMHLTHLQSETPKVNIPKLSFNTSHGVMRFSNDHTFDTTLPLQFDIKLELGPRKISATTKDLKMIARGHLDDLFKTNLTLTASQSTLRIPEEISLQKFSFHLWAGDHTLPPKGEYSVSGVRIKNASSETLLQGLSSHGKFNLGKDYHSARFTIQDNTRILSFKDIDLKYFSDSGRYLLKFPHKKVKIELSPKITEFIPLTKNIINTAFGSIELTGEIEGHSGGVHGPLHLRGEKLYLNTEYGQLRNLNFFQTFSSLPEIQTPPSQVLSIEQMIVGPTIDNVMIQSQILSSKRIKVEKLSLFYEGASIHADQFFINPLEPSLIGFKANIKNFKLQTLLQLGLKNTVSAGGRLAGHVNLRYKDKIPTIQGQLQGESHGWIRYRPPGNRPKVTIQSTDNPMDILQGYLYDFAFETLSLQIESDKNYDSIMILNTLGRNPQYVQGKPLKLNIKLEQNILAAVQSMMLTYDLPNKLKEKLEGSEAP